MSSAAPPTPAKADHELDQSTPTRSRLSAPQNDVDGANVAASCGTPDDAPEKVKSSEEEDPSRYPTGASLALLCVALCSTIFIVALSNTIISTAIPTITSVFDSYDDVGWYTCGELITTCASEAVAIVSFSISAPALLTYSLRLLPKIRKWPRRKSVG